MNQPVLDPARNEAEAFASLQRRLAPMYERLFPNPLLARTVVVVPSLSMDPRVIEKISGVQHYEERLLCMLMLLRLPRTRIVYLTSLPVDPTIVDYYLHLLPGVPGAHARRRLTLLSCHDASPVPLTSKVLARPRLLGRLQAAIDDRDSTHMTCFNVSELERRLALRLGIPIYGCDPSFDDPGTKSGGREVFRAAGVAVPPGFERLRDVEDVIEAIAELRLADPSLRRAVVKLEEGASGEGNAVVDLDEAPERDGLRRWLRNELPSRLRFEADGECWDGYTEKLAHMGGMVEAWVSGKRKRSPSVQCRIDPIGGIEVISTHDQVLGGPSGQVFKGCTFPADRAYRLAIQDAGIRVAEVLRDRGVIGRFGVDFVSCRRLNGWEHRAIEINLRKGGTTHTYLMLQFLTDGHYDVESGRYKTPTGQTRCYYASDNLVDPSYRGLSPDDLIDIAVENNLHFDSAVQQGVVFHLIGALSEFGKLGIVCVADRLARAKALYRDTVAVLDREVGAPPP